MADKSSKTEEVTQANTAPPGYVNEVERAEIERINLNANLSAKVKNSLADIPKRTLLRDVEEFAIKHELTDITPWLKKGSLIAKDSANFEGVEGLQEDERDAIRNEVLHKWRQPWPISPILHNRPLLHWRRRPRYPTPVRLSRGLTVFYSNRGPYIGTAFLGCWTSDPLNHYFGRRGAILVSAIFCIVTPIGSAVSQTWEQLLICRLLMSIGMGAKASTLPISCAENTPAAVRGGLVMSWQCMLRPTFSPKNEKLTRFSHYRWTAFGVFLGFCANLVVKDTGDISWRWFVKKGRIRDAYNSLLKLRNHPIQAARDLYYISAQVEIETEATGHNNYVTRFFQLFTIPRVRRATLASFVVMIAQQMCGINIMTFYSSTIFKEAGASVTNALLAPWGFGLVNFVFAFRAVWTIDTYRRRSLLLFTFPQMAWTLLAAGFCFWIPEDNISRLGIIAFFVFPFAAFYSPGEGPVPFTYSAEVLPLSHRAVLSITFPRMLRAMTPTGAFGFYAGLNITALVMIFL
ncbi:hypothetical protein VTO42DRAFT_2002 [Malbranchea cinnamomea]